MNRRPYAGDYDVKLLQDFNAAAIAETKGCGYVHPGDIPHRLFSGNKLFDPAEVMTIWEDDNGVAAWVLVGPRHRSYDAQVRPDLRGSGFERDVLEYADDRTVELMRRHNIEADRLDGDAFRCDTVRARLLTELGWELEERGFYVLYRAELAGLAEPVLPKGYTIRAVRGPDEAAALADVHAASFGSTWTPELYRKLMESPGYAPEREFVIVAPDGTFAAFTVTWHDRLNRIGYFEPVGTHKDHRRRGLGRAVVRYGMQQLAAVGMEYATVASFSNNEAARELYKACGFTPWYEFDQYSKPISL
jgi:ribosomal protein S18 acetylase RimI-like enzyme